MTLNFVTVTNLTGIIWQFKSITRFQVCLTHSAFLVGHFRDLVPNYYCDLRSHNRHYTTRDSASVSLPVWHQNKTSHELMRPHGIGLNSWKNKWMSTLEAIDVKLEVGDKYTKQIHGTSTSLSDTKRSQRNNNCIILMLSPRTYLLLEWRKMKTETQELQYTSVIWQSVVAHNILLLRHASG